MAVQPMTYNSSLENYIRAGLVTKFVAAEAIEAGDMVYLNGAGQILVAIDPMLVNTTGGIIGVAESKAAEGEDVIVWQSGVFEFATSVAQAIHPGQYLYATSNITVDLGGGNANEISVGMSESSTAGAATAEIVEVFITPIMKRSPYLYSSSTPYL